MSNPRPRTHYFKPLLACACISTSCALLGQRPAPDHLLFRLSWEGPADLDLHVRSPLAREIWYFEPESPSGGRLNTDCNVTVEAACAAPVERVTWPLGTAPQGTYDYWVRLMHPRESTLPIAFVVTVFQGGRQVAERHERLSEPGSTTTRWQFTFDQRR